MLRVLGAFLGVFWLLSLMVHLGGLACAFGIASLSLFAIDWTLSGFAGTRRIARLQDKRKQSEWQL